MNDELLPFQILEAGFDDNTFELKYRTIFFQVKNQNQTKFLRLLNENISIADLTDEEIKEKKYIYNAYKKD